MKIQISTHDFSKPRRDALISAMRAPGAMARAAAEAALPLFQRQMLANSRSNRNKFGARSTFWNRMNAGTRAGSQGEVGFVAMPREMRLRVKGGVVRPVNGGKFLTIPLRGEAYGKSLRQYERVFFIRRGGRLFGCTRSLAANVTSQRTAAGERKFKGGADAAQRMTVLFLLVPSATIRGNSALLPQPADVNAAVQRAVRRMLGAR